MDELRKSDGNPAKSGLPESGNAFDHEVSGGLDG